MTTRRIPDRAANPAFIMALGLLIALFSGCTRIPAVDFQIYDLAFDEARDAGEAMLLDHVSARAELEHPRSGFAGIGGVIALAQLDQELASAGVEPSDAEELRQSITDASRRLEDRAGPAGVISRFEMDVRTEAVGLHVDDIITMRFAAWDVIGRYNNLLAGLLAGVPPEQMHGAVLGLVDSIRNLPPAFDSIVGAAGALVPYAEGITFILDRVQREADARRFHDAVIQAAPLIDGLIENVLLPDAQDFYDIRLALYFMNTVPPTFDIAEFAGSYRDAARPHANDPDVAELTAEINSAWSLLPTYDPDQHQIIFDDAGDAAPSAETLNRLRQTRSLIIGMAEDVQRQATSFFAYKDAMTGYARVLDRLQRSNHYLVTALQTSSDTSPLLEELLEAAVQAKRAFALYRNTR